MSETIRKFISDSIIKLKTKILLKQFLKSQDILVSDISIIKTPIEYKINIIYSGKKIINKNTLAEEISNLLKKYCNIDNVKLEFFKVSNPLLDPILVASKIEKALIVGKPIRPTLYEMLYSIRDAGAIGAEIAVKGKLGARGAKARKIKVRFGFIPKAGDLQKYVKKTKYQAVTKSGVIGVSVMITPPEALPFLKVDKDEEKGTETKE